MKREKGRGDNDKQIYLGKRPHTPKCTHRHLSLRIAVQTFWWLLRIHYSRSKKVALRLRVDPSLEEELSSVSGTHIRQL